LHNYINFENTRKKSKRYILKWKFKNNDIYIVSGDYINLIYRE